MTEGEQNNEPSYKTDVKKNEIALAATQDLLYAYDEPCDNGA